MSAAELVARLRSGDISAREAIAACIASIEAVDGSLNAVAVPRFEAALDEADAADRRREGASRSGPSTASRSR